MYEPLEYFEQTGGGCFGKKSMYGEGISNVYVGRDFQRDHGVGSFLGGLSTKALPLIRRGIQAVGKESLRSGLNVLSDVSRGVPVKQSFSSRVKESGSNLSRKMGEKFDDLMSGRGRSRRRKYKRSKTTKQAQSTRRRRRRKTGTAAKLKRKIRKKQKKTKRSVKHRRQKKRKPAKPRKTRRTKKRTTKRRGAVKLRCAGDIFN